MELEQTLRLAFMPREPALDFEEAVMARVSAATWRASHAAPRRLRRVLLIGSLCMVTVAAAMLALWYSGSLNPVAPRLAQVAAVQETGSRASGLEQPAAPASVPPGAESVPPGEPTLAELCTDAAAALPATYTVLVQPLQIEMADPVIQSSLRQYYDSLVDQVRNVPGLTLTGIEAQPLVAKPADFRLTVAGIDNRDAELPADRTEWQVKLQLEIWRGNMFGKAIFTQHPGSDLYSSDCRLISGPVSRCGPAGRARMDAQILLGNSDLPITGDAQLSTFPTPGRVACRHETQKRAQRTMVDSAIKSSAVLQVLERLAAERAAGSRQGKWSFLRNQLHPEQAQGLVTALRESMDDDFRKEVVTLLAVDFSDDSAVRAALAEVAASGPDTLMRHVAERAVSGDGPWHDYAVARVRDTSLSTTQRLEAWYWMADTMPLDQQKMSATMADALTALQRGDGVHVLAQLLADTQKDPAGPGYGVAGQQGQMAMRQIGSVNHPAAPALLIACFDTMPNYITFSVLATRRDDPRVVSRLESIAADQTDPQLSKRAASLLRQPPDLPRTSSTGN